MFGSSWHKTINPFHAAIRTFYHAYWCPGSFCHQVISNHGINYVPSAGGRLNIKMLSYQYGDPHVKDKTVLQLSYL